MDHQPNPIDSKVTVTIPANRMTAVISATPPQNGGQPLSEAMIREALAFHRVTAGIDEDKIAQLAAHPVYGPEVEIARGAPAQNGENSRLEYHFQRDAVLKPKELADGSVDYRELGLIQTVEEGQVLMSRTPATEGADGYDVLGRKIAARRGREVPFPAGKNTVVSEDGLQLLAAKTGHVEAMGARVTVLDTFTVKGDVSTATGNINFSGNVLISGSVLAGYTVRAAGSIQIRGACEACTLIADGSITIGEGMNGGKIDCKGDLHSKYLQNCEVVCAGNAFSGAVINCNLRCGGTLTLQGSRGTLMGGSCLVGSSIEAMFIGSQNTHVPTRVEVGLDPVVQKRLQEAPKELEQAARLLEQLRQVVTLLEQYEAAGRLDAEKAHQLQNARYTSQMEAARKEALEEEMAQLTEKSKLLGYGSILAKGTIAPGVRIVIGPFQLPVQNTLVRPRVTRGEDGIQVNTAF